MTAAGTAAYQPSTARTEWGLCSMYRNSSVPFAKAFALFRRAALAVQVYTEGGHAATALV